jgi:hypothetical protein
MKKNPIEAPQTPNLGKLKGFFAVTMVVLLLALATLALIGPYQLALADWQVAREAIANSQDS